MVDASPAARLDADLIARAIVAAASAYGDDPALALVTEKKVQRRAITAAADALSEVAPLRSVARILGVADTSVIHARQRGRRHHLAAVGAARQAIGPGEDLVGPGDASPSPVPVPQPAAPARSVGPIYRPALAPPGAPVGGGITEPKAAPGTMPAQGSLGGRILGLLAEEAAAWTSVALATVLDVKELYVGQALNLLGHQGLAEADALTERGPRAQVWRIRRGAEHG